MMHIGRLATARQVTVAALTIIAALVVLAVPAHAQDPLISTTARLRNSVLTSGQNIGVVALVFGFIGMMWPGHNHQEKLMWLMVGGAGLWSISAIISTFIT